MTLTQIEYILAIHLLGSISKAAEYLNVTQPTISMQVQKAEEELEILLFDRSKKPISLTENGKIILEHLQNIQRSYEKLDEIKQSMKGEPQGEIRIGIIPTLSPYLLPLFLMDFSQKYPKIKLVINDFTTEQIIDKIKNNQLDAGILATPLAEAMIKERKLFLEQFTVYASESSKIFAKKSVKAIELDDENVFLMEEGHCLRAQALQICQNSNLRISPSVQYAAGSLETLMRLVEINEAVTLIPELAAIYFDELRWERVRYFENPVPVRQISLVTHKSDVKQRLFDILAKNIIENLPIEILSKEKDFKVVPIF